MRIGFDVDGVLANFIPEYQKLVVQLSGKDLFHPGDDVHPPCWLWPEMRGYSPACMSEVWKVITGSHDFWMGLQELPGCSTLRLCILDLMRWHDVYFITSRPGKDAKWQSEQWLMLHLEIDRPTVLISSAKGLCAKALKLDCYIDDNADNVTDVVLQTDPGPMTRTYLLNASYNKAENMFIDSRVRRVYSLGQFLDAELQNL